MGMLAKIRRMHFRDRMSLREVSRRTGLSRNTVRSWLRRPEIVEPKYPPRKSAGKLEGWTEVLRTWLRSDSRRAKRARVDGPGRPRTRCTTERARASSAQARANVLPTV